jgi:light-regulated signal transduction histidine kinase (bacteriophytochrome)
VTISGSYVRNEEVQSPSYFKLDVSDNGIGFEEKYAKKIFGMFQRLHVSSDYAGTGMGLTICKRVMDNHHGFIVGKGTPGQGATFSCYFPLEKVVASLDMRGDQLP